MKTVAGPAPTGCYKCGRPGHWSRDCPSNPSSFSHIADDATAGDNAPLNPNSNSNSKLKPPLQIQKPRQKKVRPKLTPDLLLSDAGIGRILRYFPKAFKYRGRGHEVGDLRNLLSLYVDWHSRLLPYYNFDQFVHKVEQVGGMRRVKVCLGELRDKVSHDINPTEVQEPQQVKPNSVDILDDVENADFTSNLREHDGQSEDFSSLPQGIYKEATQDTVEAPDTAEAIDDTTVVKEVSHQNQISEEQKARMEANKLKALERAVARSRSLRP